MNEIITIASGTWKNVLRMKVVYFLIFCALAPSTTTSFPWDSTKS